MLGPHQPLFYPETLEVHTGEWPRQSPSKAPVPGTCYMVQATVIVTNNMLGHRENMPGDWYTLVYSPSQPALERGTFIIPVLQMRKWRYSQAKYLA